METSRIAELLAPFTADALLPASLLQQLQLYLHLLLRWNARINLTAVRSPESIVVRHFGESLFAARLLLKGDASHFAQSLADVGSGAGFPGVPSKLFAPYLHLTLIESQSKKATFLRELLRTLHIEDADVFCGRAEQWGRTAGLVTLRAVEKFERALPVAAGLVADDGKLCLLIGQDQTDGARKILNGRWTWGPPALIPQSEGRVVFISERSPG